MARQRQHQTECIITIILALTFFGLVKGQSMKVTLGPLEEEKGAQVYVGNIARATSISTDVSQAVFNTLKFEFLDPSNTETHLFSINGKSSAIYTKASIDRESICEDLDDCLIRFDVTVSSEFTDFLRLVEVTVNITDTNDNVPKFPKQTITVNVPENNAAGWSKPLPTAVDKDTLHFSVQEYKMLTRDVPFTLNVEHRRYNKFSISLVANKMLDREERSHYTLRVIAVDGGAQPLTGTLTVNVNVTDANDNSPRFSQQDYSFSVKETSSEGSVLGKVTATDLDAGGNGDVRYTLNFPSKDETGPELFAIDNYSGEITIKAPLQYNAGETFSAVVEVKDQGEVPNVADATLTITVLNVDNNAPRLELKLQKTVYPDTVIISEGARDNTFVGKLTATDNDPGASGQVACMSRHPSFKTVNFGDYFTIILNGSLDREQNETVDVTLVCFDGGRPSMTSSVTFHVIVDDINDNSPKFSKRIYEVNVTEENVVGKPILRLTAHDPDSGINNVFTYSLFPKENSVFSIDSDSGILKARTTFDHEVERKLNVIVIAVDEGVPARTSTATVVVNIIDINDNYPMILTQSIHVSEGGGRMREVGYLVGKDRDSGRNAQLVFSMTPVNDVSSQVFRVNPDGTVLAIQELDRERQDRYLLRIQVRDRGVEAKTQSSTVTVIIDDVNDNAPVFLFPSNRNQSFTIMWSTPADRQIVRVRATDADSGQNGTVAYYIKDGNQAALFAVDSETGALSLRRQIKASDDQVHHLTIAAHDWGLVQQESHHLLKVIVDVTNATFAALEGDEKRKEEKYTLIAGIVAGVTLLLSVIILVIIFLVRRGHERRPPPPVDKHMEWQVVKTGIQEECGKGEVIKVPVWRGSNVDIDIRDQDDDEVGKGGNFSPGSPPDVTKIGNDVTFKKTMSPNATWHDGQDGFIQSHTIGIGLDPYRKHDFYTFCKVRTSHDDVNSVTSGETATSDSGRGGSEDDIPLPPIAECSPEFNTNSNNGSPKHMTEYRPITTLPSNSMARHGHKSDYKTLPSMSSFKCLDVKSHPLQGDPSLSNTLPYNSDKVHPSSRPSHAYTSMAQVPAKTGGQSRHVTFSNPAPRGSNCPTNVRDDINYEISRRSPYGAGYENFIPEAGGLYVSLPRCPDDDDGNTTTSGSYTIDSDNLNDSIISA